MCAVLHQTHEQSIASHEQRAEQQDLPRDQECYAPLRWSRDGHLLLQSVGHRACSVAVGYTSTGAPTVERAGQESRQGDLGV